MRTASTRSRQNSVTWCFVSVWFSRWCFSRTINRKPTTATCWASRSRTTFQSRTKQMNWTRKKLQTRSCVSRTEGEARWPLKVNLQHKGKGRCSKCLSILRATTKHSNAGDQLYYKLQKRVMSKVKVKHKTTIGYRKWIVWLRWYRNTNTFYRSRSRSLRTVSNHHLKK